MDNFSFTFKIIFESIVPQKYEVKFSYIIKVFFSINYTYNILYFESILPSNILQFRV